METIQLNGCQSLWSAAMSHVSRMLSILTTQQYDLIKNVIEYASNRCFVWIHHNCYDINVRMTAKTPHLLLEIIGKDWFENHNRASTTTATLNAPPHTILHEQQNHTPRNNSSLFDIKEHHLCIEYMFNSLINKSLSSIRK